MSDADGEGKKDYMKYCYYKRKKLLNHLTNGGGVGVGGGKRSLCWGTPAKTLQNLQPVASKVMILRLWHHQDSQATIYIDTRL